MLTKDPEDMTDIRHPLLPQDLLFSFPGKNPKFLLLVQIVPRSLSDSRGCFLFCGLCVVLVKAAGSFLQSKHNFARYTEVMQMTGRPFQMVVCSENDTGHRVPELTGSESREWPPWRRGDA